MREDPEAQRWLERDDERLNERLAQEVEAAQEEEPPVAEEAQPETEAPVRPEEVPVPESAATTPMAFSPGGWPHLETDASILYTADVLAAGWYAWWPIESQLDWVHLVQELVRRGVLQSS